MSELNIVTASKSDINSLRQEVDELNRIHDLQKEYLQLLEKKIMFEDQMFRINEKIESIKNDSKK